MRENDVYRGAGRDSVCHGWRAGGAWLGHGRDGRRLDRAVDMDRFGYRDDRGLSLVRARSMSDRRWVDRGLTLCPYLGLFGTALGICQELQAIHSDADIARVVSGLGIAFWSTVSGIGSAIVIYLQGIALEAEHVSKWVAIPFIDTLLLIVGVIALLAHPVAKTAASRPIADYVLYVVWDTGLDEDIDVFVQGPDGQTTWYRNRDIGYASIDRDDLGSIGTVGP